MSSSIGGKQGHQRPSRQMSISNLKRSLSKSSSISSLKSVLKYPFQKSDEYTEEYIHHQSDNPQMPPTIKRKKEQLFGDISFKKIKLFKRFKNSDNQRFHAVTKNDLGNQNLSAEPFSEAATSKSIPTINVLDSSNTKSQAEAKANSYYHSHENLSRLESKVFTTSRGNKNGLKAFARIDEEDREPSNFLIPPSKTVFNFDTVNNSQSSKELRSAPYTPVASPGLSMLSSARKIRRSPNNRSIVTSKGCYNLSQIIKDTDPASYGSDDNDRTMLDSTGDSKFSPKVSPEMPSHQTSSSVNNSYLNDSDTLIEDESNMSNILADINGSQDQGQGYSLSSLKNHTPSHNISPETYLDFFNNTIEPIHQQNRSQFVQNYFTQIQTKQLGQDQGQSTVQHITKKLSLANLNEKSSNDINVPLDFHAPKYTTEPIVKQHAAYALELPEILERILSFVEDNVVLPVEKSPLRRKPLSYEHAKLIYKDKKFAETMWKNVNNKETNERLNELILANYLKHENGIDPRKKNKFYANTVLNQSSKNFQSIKIINKTIYNCLFVNRLWHSIAKKLIFKKLFFKSDSNFQKLVSKIKNDETNLDFKNCFKNASTNVLLMHKLKNVTQDQVNLLANYVIASGNRLEWIEMYICPSVYPPLSLFTSNPLSQNVPSRLKKLVLAGSNSKKINNFFLKIVANNCPNLEKIDLRSCEHFSDTGLIEISVRCRKLTYLNVGRYNNRDKITDASILSVIKNVRNLKTLGCAGCYITDASIWNLASHQNFSIEKLSLNNCIKLTNDSIPKLLEQQYLPKLQVLEIRNITNIDYFKPIIEFKKKKFNDGEFFLVENCEILEKRMMQQEFSMNLEISKNMLCDIANWCHDPNDGDMDLNTFVAQKRAEIHYRCQSQGGNISTHN